ncbi:unnamed protein product, partial [Brenthis ino]
MGTFESSYYPISLDSESRKQWEFSVTNNNSSEELPTFNQFSEFLTNRYRALEFLDTKSATVTKDSQYNNNVNKFRTFVASANKIQCAFCSEDHRIIHCKRFSNETVDARRNFVQTHNICFNCLGNNHSAKSCQSSNKCRICKRQHHSLLHPPSSGISGANAETTKNNNGNIGSSSSESNNEMESTPLATFFSTGLVRNQVLLATALVKAASKTGEHYIIRALLDQGSQKSFVTEATVQYLGLKKIPIREQVSVLGGNSNVSPKAMVFIQLKSMIDPNYNITVKAYVLKTITSFLPAKRITALEWLEALEIELADPNYHTPNKIDVLLGAEVYDKIIQEGIKKGPQGSPVVQNTSFGWIVSGEVTTSTREENHTEFNTFHCRTDDNDMLKQFWELESDLELTKQQRMTHEEQVCEELFARTTERDEDGTRYRVNCLGGVVASMYGCTLGGFKSRVGPSWAEIGRPSRNRLGEYHQISS